MVLSEQQLVKVLPRSQLKAGVFISALNAAMSHHQIITPERMAAFLAQIGHESGQLLYVRELGSDQYLSKYDTGTLAARLGNTPEADGDGQKYRGRGLFRSPGGAITWPAAKRCSATSACCSNRNCWSSRNGRVSPPHGSGKAMV